jgi:hypothetical protein
MFLSTDAQKAATLSVMFDSQIVTSLWIKARHCCAPAALIIVVLRSILWQ